MSIQAILSSTSEIEGSKRKELPTVSNLQSEFRITYPALPLAPQMLLSKLILTNPRGGDFEEMKITFRVATKAMSPWILGLEGIY